MVEEIGQTLYHSRAVRVFEAEGSRMYLHKYFCTLHTILRRYAAVCCKYSNVSQKGSWGILDMLWSVLSENVDEVVLGYNSYVSYQYADKSMWLMVDII